MTVQPGGTGAISVETERRNAYPAAAVANPEHFAEYVRRMGIELTVFRHDSYGELAPVARLLHYHLPEMAKRMGARIGPDEGHPPAIEMPDAALAVAIGRDAIEARKVVGWLHARNHEVAPELLVRGEPNIVNVMVDKFAAEKGFVRDDDLAREAGRATPSGHQDVRIGAILARAHNEARMAMR